MYIKNCLRSEEKKIIFYTTEKANCTEVVAIFFDYCDHLQKALEYSSWIHDYRWKVYVKAHPTKIEDLRSRKYFRVKFVRCPFERAISSFAQMHRQRRKLENYHLSFNEFLDELSKEAGILRYEDITVNPHFCTQSFRKERGFQWDAVAHIENLHKELNEVKKQVQLPNRFLLFRSNHWNKGKRVVPSGRDRSEEPIENCRTLYYPDVYNEKTIAKVKKLYAIDFDFHPEYTFEYFLERFRVPDYSLVKKWLLLN